MKYYCENCGIVLDEDNLKEYSEGRPGAYGAPCSETFYVCPECGHIPGEYNNQDKTCKECVLYRTDACCYGGENPNGKVCGDYLGDE